MSPTRLSALAALAFALSNATAVDYFVSPSGNDSNSGTSPFAPWQTIDQVNSRTFAAGDRILFQGGQAFTGNLYFDATDAGTAASPITISSYGSGYATIDAGEWEGIYVENTGGYVISNLIVIGGWNSATQTGSDASGISFFCSIGGAVKLPYIRIQNVTVSGFKNTGISIGAWPADNTMSGYNDVQIIGCTAFGNGDCGIQTWGYLASSATTYAHTDVVVRDCTVYDNRGIINKGHHSGSGIILGGVNGGLLERCLAYNNGELSNYTGGGPVGLWTYDSNAITIQFCESHSNKTGAGTPDGGGFDLDGGVTNSILQYNYSHDNYGPGFMIYQYSGARPSLSNNIIRYNISQNDARKRNYGAIYAAGGTNVRNNQIYNNTIYLTKPGTLGPAPFKAGGIGTGNAVRNNIFVTTNGLRMLDVPASANITFQGNNYWPSGAAFSIKWGTTIFTDLQSWRDATGQEKLNAANIGMSADPLLTSPGGGGTINDPYQLPQLTAYKLLPGSPMLDAGLNLPALFGASVGSGDYYGSPLPQGSAYDIGAHEAVAALFAQDFSMSTSLSAYVSTAPTQAQLNNLQTYNVGIGTPPVPEFWSIAAGRLQVQRTTISNPSGFTRIVSAGITPSLLKVKFKLRVSAGMSGNAFGDLAIFDTGNITTVTGYNTGTASTVVANRIIIKGAGAGLYRLRLNSSPAIDSPSFAFNGGAGEPLDVEWFVNQSGALAAYTSPTGSETLAHGACDLFINGTRVNNDAARNSAFTANTMGGFRFRATATKSLSTDPDIIIDLDDLEVVPLN